MLPESSPGRYWQRSQFERFNEAAAFAAEQHQRPLEDRPCRSRFNEAADFAAEQPAFAPLGARLFLQASMRLRTSPQSNLMVEHDG